MKTIDWKSELYHNILTALSFLLGMLTKGKMDRILGEELNSLLSSFINKTTTLKHAAEFKSTLDSDQQQLLRFLLDENFICTGPMAETSIQAGISSLRRDYNWNKVEVYEKSFDDLFKSKAEKNFLRIIFYVPKKLKFFCFIPNNDLHFRRQGVAAIIGLFKGSCGGQNKVLEAVFCPLSKPTE